MMFGATYQKLFKCRQFNQNLKDRPLDIKFEKKSNDQINHCQN